MSNEVYIDGCNVAECSYYNEEDKPYCCEVWQNECEAQLCYFKQLQRLKAENEKLKEQKNEYYQNNLTYERQISELIRSLKDIKELIEFRFHTAYMTLGFREYDEIIENIEKIADEVLKCG